MSLAARYQKPDTRTAFEKWLENLSPDHHKLILSWLTDEEIPNTRISDWIRDDEPEEGFIGYRASKDTISAWRRRNGIG